jgi:hypothetical protein
VGDVIGLTCYLYTLEARLPRLLPPVENYRYRPFILLAYPNSLCSVADLGCLSRILTFFPCWTSNLGSYNKKRKGKNKLLVLPFFVTKNFTRVKTFEVIFYQVRKMI